MHAERTNVKTLCEGFCVALIRAVLNRRRGQGRADGPDDVKDSVKSNHITILFAILLFFVSLITTALAHDLYYVIVSLQLLLLFIWPSRHKNTTTTGGTCTRCRSLQR